MVTNNDGDLGTVSLQGEPFYPGDFHQAIGKPEKNTSRRRGIAKSGLLENIIERQILPRLVIQHPSQRKSLCDSSTLEALGKSERLADTLLSGSVSALTDVIQPYLANGVPTERLFLKLLAPLARTVGRYWEEDRWTFFDVTMALNVLHRALRELDAHDWTVGTPSKSVRKSIYLASVPGEQHVFGVRMVESLFAHAGWQVTCDCSATEADVVRTISKHHFDVVGFSVGRADFLDPLNRAIDKTRRASRNRNVHILLGGNVFQRFPEFAREFKNAVVADDGLDAVSKALSRVDGDVGDAEAVSP